MSELNGSNEKVNEEVKEETKEIKEETNEIGKDESTELNSNRKLKRLIYKIIFMAALIGFGICAGILFRNWWVEYRAIKQNEINASKTTQQTQRPTNPEPDSETESESSQQPEDWGEDYLAYRGITIPQLNIDWEDLWSQNKDVYAWLYLPETSINYPILQHPTDTDYYLDHNLDGSGPRPGCIYSQIVNSKDFTDYNTVLYGHRSHMFMDLGIYEGKDNFNHYRYMYVYLPGGQIYVYEVVAAVSYSDVLIPAAYDVNSASQCRLFLNDVFSVRKLPAITKEDHENVEGNRLLTLSTCFPYDVQDRRDERYIVVGALVNDPIFVEEWRQQALLGDE